MENEALNGAFSLGDGTNDTSATDGESAVTPLTEGVAEEAEGGADTPPSDGLPTEGEARDGEADEGEDGRDFATLEAADAAALAAVFPRRFGTGDLSGLENPERYGELREAGLSPLEAYCASHYEALLARRPRDTRAHLDSCAVRTAKSGADRMSATELSAARELFPSLSDGELEGLYRRARYGGR